MSLAKTLSFDFSCRDGNLYMRIYFTQLPLPKFYPKLGNCLKDLFIQLFGQICSNIYENFENTSKKFHCKSEIQKLYDKLTEKRKTDKFNYNIEENVQHHNLKPQLRPYQQESVKWMLYRERMEDSKTDFLHPLYIPIKLQSDIEIYFDKYTGFICNEKPITTLSTKIGILADEMGLGKTVEVLACILLNPKVESEEIKNDHSRKRKSSDDESEGPIIEIPKKKSKKLKGPKEPLYVEEPSEVQAIKPREVQATKLKEVKVKKGKSQTFIALNMWYNNILAETSTINSKRFEDVDRISVQCVCGSTSERTAIGCSSCNIYQHPKCLGYTKSLGEYFCPQCWINQPLVESKATLIVTPIALKTQWCNEIAKHIKGNLRVLQYQGHSINSVYPTELKEYDIVLTTYSVLQHELKLTHTEEAKNLRQGKKYFKPGCPLTRIKWWRLCLDEAQTVDTPDRLVSVMARKIEAVHRWAVTGTPISKNISDLYGLIDYLQISPYKDLTTWQKILYQPYLVGNEEPLLNFLSTILWRTSKKDVADQVDIPKQTHLHHTLDFCAVEKYFYKREHEIRGRFFAERCNRYDPAICLDTLDKQALKKILEPVLTLRQICVTMTTPKGTFLASRKEVKSMKDLLDALILTSTNDTEDCLRLVISAYNGIAGIHLLLQNPQEAINTYREVLQLVAKFSEENSKIRLTVDKPQVIHTLYNLAEVLDIYPPEHPTLRDTSLRNDCEEVETKYLEKFISESHAAFVNFQSLTLDMEKLQNRFLLKDGQWYSDGLEWIVLNGFSKELHAKISTACSSVGILNEDRDVNDGTLLQLLYNWDNTLSMLREELFSAVTNLYEYNPDSIHKIVIERSLVTKAMNCHLRPQKKREKSTKKCPVCVSNNCLKRYELKLFNMTQRTETFEEMSLKGDWKPTYPEIVMQSLHNILKLQNANQEFIKDGGTQINMINTMKKEFKELRKFWTYLDQQICAMDELDICKVRLQLKPEEEEKERSNNILKNLTYELQNKHETIHLLSVHELDYQLMLLQNDVSDNTRKLEKLLGTQSYLETLRKQQYEGQSPDPCPICHNQLERHWSILSCGHCYCLECIHVILEQVSEDCITCSVCRNRQFYHEVSYINAGETVKNNSVQIKGSYSTKIAQIVKVLMELKKEDKDAKVLLFSSWKKVLDAVKQALDKNDISCELALSNNLDVKITSFKDPAKDIMVLLLPVALGSKGLNLIEANHVMFAEPLLNPADELQAIGRIDRIGQKRNTFIHKFLMKNTIEENIHQATTSNAQNWEKNAVTIQRMLDLFKVPELADRPEGET
ncbi:E3 ubiquitin-protein ligase SHPRH isoform X2 [Diabrotica virgifera virgifera]|nr:E3 ubiquitin-protein ligase SHPRH isoform X2 [Diabrotica virgifera virgifera]